MPDRASKELRWLEKPDTRTPPNVLPGGVLLFAFLMKAGGQSLKPEERAFCFFAWIHPVSRFFSDAPQKTPAGSFLSRRGSFPDGLGWATQAISLLNMMGKNEKPL